MKKNIIKHIALISITLFFLNYLIKNQLISLELLQLVITEKYPYLAISCLFYFSALLTVALRFQYVLKKFKIKINFDKIFAIQSLSLFLGQFLPFSAAITETFKIYIMSKYYNILEWKKITFCTILDKFLGLGGYFFISFFFISLFYKKISSIINDRFYLIIIIFMIGVLLINAVKLINFINLKRFNYNYEYKHGKEIIISLFSSLFVCFSYYFIFLATGLKINFYIVAIVMPLIIFSFIIPIGLGGFGGYQLIAVFIFSFFDNSPQIITTASLIFASISFLTNGVLGLIYVTKYFDILLGFFKIK
jgi:uncharacterized membrane protein YbhN (UPF0104 family)